MDHSSNETSSPDQGMPVVKNPAQVFEMSVWDIRLLLAQHGWHSEDRHTTFGWGKGFGYSVWAFRWNWHGKRLGSRVSFHESLKPEETQDYNVLEMWRHLAYETLYAWNEFPDSIPCQNVEGEIVEDHLATRLFRESIARCS